MTINLRKEWTSPATVGLVSFASGLATGYFVSKRKFQKELDQIADRVTELATQIQQEVAEEEQKTRSFPAPVTNAQILSTPRNSPHDVEVAERFVRSLSAAAPDAETPQPVVPDPVEPVRQNIFEDEWDVAEEMANRSPDSPYVLHINEFHDREKGYSQRQLTWYDGDKILADENGALVYGPERIVGQLPFGKGSRDPDVVYIRNDSLNAEYEVTRVPGRYQVEVLGIMADEQAEQDDLKHSSEIRRFRTRD